MASTDIIAFISEKNSHFKKRKFRIFAEINEGEVLSIKFRSLIHIRDMSSESEKEISDKIRMWSHGSMAATQFADGALDITVNPLHRAYKTKTVEDTITLLLAALNIPEDLN